MSSCNCSSIHVHKPAETAVPVDAVEALFAKPFSDLLFEAQTAHRKHFDPNKVQLSTLLSIKTGGCPEDCGYCPQYMRHPNAVEDEPMLDVDTPNCGSFWCSMSGNTPITWTTRISGRNSSKPSGASSTGTRRTAASRTR